MTLTGSSTVSAMAHALRRVHGHRSATLNSTLQAIQLPHLIQLLSLTQRILSSTNTRMSANLIRIRICASMVALAINHGQQTTLTSGYRWTRPAGVCPSKECHKAMIMVKMIAKKTQLVCAMDAVIADGVGLAILQTNGPPQSQCAVACQSKRNGPTVMSAQHFMMKSAGLTALIASGRGHSVSLGIHKELHAVAMQVQLRRSSGVVSVPHLQMAFAGQIVQSAVGRGKPQI